MKDARVYIRTLLVALVAIGMKFDGPGRLHGSRVHEEY